MDDLLQSLVPGTESSSADHSVLISCCGDRVEPDCPQCPSCGEGNPLMMFGVL